MRKSVHKQNQTQNDGSRKAAPTPDSNTNAILQLQSIIGNQAVLNLLESQERNPDLEEDPQADKGEASLQDECDKDAALDAEFDEWIHYDPDKDAEETAIVNRINKEIFGPINRERNKIAADSFENTEAKKKAFPITGRPEINASPELMKLYDTPSYTRLHSTADEDIDTQRSIGLTQPLGDLSATGKMEGTTFGAISPPTTIWDYHGDAAKAAVGNLDTTVDSPDIKGNENISGYAEFKDSKGQRLFVPQLGFSRKPPIDTRQVMCKDVPVVKPGEAKRRGGPTGQNVTSSSLADIFHGGKHFFSTRKSPTITGKDKVLGYRSGPGKPPQWKSRQLPDDPDERKKIKKNLREQAEEFIKAKRKNHENLQQYYQQRAAFIAKYKDLLK